MGNCSQTLEHRGTVNFVGPVNFYNEETTFHNDVTFEGDIILPDDGTGEAKILQWAKATANWTNVAGTGKKSYVNCTKVDGSGSAVSGGGTIQVYLPRTAQQDPNVRADDIVGYIMDLDGDAVCVTGYLDDKIGTVKQWALAIAAIPPGWRLMDGTQGGSGLNAGGRVLAGYLESSTDYGSVGAIGGLDNHTHPPHEASDINSHIGYQTLPSDTLTTTTELVFISIGPVTFDTLCALAGVQMPSGPVPVALGAGMVIQPNPHFHTPGTTLSYQPGSGTIQVVTPADGADLAIPPQTVMLDLSGIQLEEGICTCAEVTTGHCHALPYHNHDATAVPHHHSIAPHLHNLPEMDHDGILIHEAADHRDRWLTLAWIERID